MMNRPYYIARLPGLGGVVAGALLRIALDLAKTSSDS
jgi:hypothetical protein